jgi:hypothetical protein
MGKKTKEEFSVFLLDNDLEIIEYLKGGFVLVKGKFGIHKVRIEKLKKYQIPSIKSCVDKCDYVKNKIKSIHGDKYDLDNVVYSGIRTKIKLTCPHHGEFEIEPFSIFSQRAGCSKCGHESSMKLRSSSYDVFVEKSNRVHDFKFKYPTSEYKNQESLMLIECPNHGLFLQKAKDHLSGRGCMLCGNEKISKTKRDNPPGWSLKHWEKSAINSKSFDSFKVYIIRCWSEDEEFVKIGRTFTTVADRYHRFNKLPYKYEILSVIEGSAEFIYNKEIHLKNKCKNFKYTPNITFGGMYECFDNYILNLIYE